MGLGEDGLKGLTPASAEALGAADIVMGPARHLGLLPQSDQDHIAWPVPFADGLDRLAALKGRHVVVLTSGDPFWFGAGRVIAERFSPGEWRAFPGPSCFSLTAAALGWGLEGLTCLGLHAAPLARLRRHLNPGARLIVTLRDGDSVPALGAYLAKHGFGASALHVFEHLGGPQERYSSHLAEAVRGPFAHPVCAAVEVAGADGLCWATGQEDDVFDHDGQITKRLIRAATLSSLAPRPGAHLWDIGGGSGSISMEWLLAHPNTNATCMEPKSDRVARIKTNAENLGVENRLTLVQSKAQEGLRDLARPNAVFVGGGLSEALLETLFTFENLRLVANAVTLESEAILARWHAKKGGELTRLDIAHARALGSMRGWDAAFPVVQWRVNL